jgi:hypothetical protein
MKSCGHWETEEFNLCAFLLNVSLTKTHVLCCSGHVLEHVSDMRGGHCSQCYSYAKTCEDQNWPNMGAAWTKFVKNVKSKFHCLPVCFTVISVFVFLVVAVDVGRIYTLL